MPLDIEREVAELKSLKMNQLVARFTDLFGEPPRSRHRTWLVRRIAWRLQALEEGDLSERARQRARELARDADLRLMAPRPSHGSAGISFGAEVLNDKRLPLPGAELTRNYKGRLIVVKVLTKGFEYEGQRFASLSAIAKIVTGAHWNGFYFFGLKKPRGKA